MITQVLSFFEIIERTIIAKIIITRTYNHWFQLTTDQNDGITASVYGVLGILVVLGIRQALRQAKVYPVRTRIKNDEDPAGYVLAGPSFILRYRIN